MSLDEEAHSNMRRFPLLYVFSKGLEVMKTSKLKPLLMIAAIGVVVGTAYTNCSNPKFDSVSDAVVSSAGDIIVPPGSTQDDREVIVKKLCEPGNTVKKVQSIHFANPLVASNAKATCGWGKNGNQGNENLRQSTGADPESDINRQTEDKFTARAEQRVSLDLPAGAVICDMDFRFQAQSMKYDDHMFFMYDDVVLAATKPIDHLLENANGMSIYDWTKLVMKPWKIGDSTPYVYCLGMAANSADCKWPLSATMGQIKMDFSPATLQRVTARNLSRNQHSFTLVTTGDNNPEVDCQHDPMTFEVEFSYSSL
jgi:hypothetical protein